MEKKRHNQTENIPRGFIHGSENLSKSSAWMKLSSLVALRPVCVFSILTIVVLLFPTSVISIWCITTKRVEFATELGARYIHMEAVTDIEIATRYLFPSNTSTLNIARVLHTSLNTSKLSFSTFDAKVTYQLFLALKTLRLSQISYIGLDGSFYSYYIEGNQTFVMYSNTENVPNIYRYANNGSIVYNCYTQQVDNDVGERYTTEKSLRSLISIDASWLQNALSNSLNGYASLGRGWGKSQVNLFLSTFPVDGLGVVSFGFPMKAIDDAISRINLHGGDLYLATKDGILLAHTGPHSVKLKNGTISIIITNSSDNIATQQMIDITCDSNDNPLRRTRDIKGTKYMFYCAPLDIAGIPSVWVMVCTHKGLVNEIHRHSKIAELLLIVLLVSLVITISFFIFLVIRAARREMFLCAALIKQMEATQHEERKNMNKSLAFASASHDVRSSLAALDGIITLCSIEVNPDSETYMYLKQMTTFTADLLKILNSVLETSKIEAGKMSLIEDEFHLAQVLEESVNLYFPVGIDKGIDLVLDPCDGSIVRHCLVKGDRAKLKQVFNNLLHNAIKFTSDGHIVIRAWVKKPNSEKSLIASKKNGAWNYLSRILFKNNDSYSDLTSLQAAQQHQNSVEFVFEVDDTGIGVPKEKQNSVFEDFVQAKDTTVEHEGTGLGLGIVRSLVRLMGGDIQIVDKDLGERGTCFRFNIFLSICDTAFSTSVVEGEASRLLLNQLPVELNMSLETNIQNQSPGHNGSEVVLFIHRRERRKILHKFLESMGIKVSSIERLEHLFPTLERIKHKWHLSHLSSSGKSDMVVSLTDSLSASIVHDINLGTQDECLNVKYGRGYPLPLHRKASYKRTFHFVLIVIDFNDAHFNDAQFMEVYSIIESFRKDICDSRCKIVWLYTPKTDGEARRLDEEKLAKCELIVSKPLHGSRLFQLLKLLPEFGFATTIQGYKPNIRDKSVQPSIIHDPSASHTYMRSDSRTLKSHHSHEIQEVMQRECTPSNDKLLAGKKVLVAEDNLILRKVAVKILQQHGATVDYCENGEEAVKQICKSLQKGELRDSSLPYDFIFMDCEMPVMDGYEAVRQIRLEEKFYNVRFPIIALTAHTQNEEQSKILLAGMDTIITKPLSREKLCKAIHSVNKYEDIIVNS